MIEMEQPSRVRVTMEARVVEETSPNLDRIALRDANEVVLSNPTVTNGMIVGTTDAGPVARVVLGDVRTIEVQERDAVRTGVLAGGIALVSALFVLLLGTLSGGCPGNRARYLQDDAVTKSPLNENIRSTSFT